MEFGKDECFRLLVCASETMLFAWDVITQGLQWKFEQPLSSPIICLTVDPKSIYMAAVLKNSERKSSIKSISYANIFYLLLTLFGLMLESYSSWISIISIYVLMI